MNRKLRGFAGSLERSDLGLLVSVGVLLLLGVIVVYGAGSYNRQALHSPLGQHYIVAKHLFMIGVGFVAMFSLMNLDYHWFRARWLNWGGLVGLLRPGALTLLTVRAPSRHGARDHQPLDHASAASPSSRWSWPRSP